MTSTYREFYLDAPARVREYELIEISHPNFTQTYRIARNKVGGVTAVIDGAPQFFQYYPLLITSKGTRADLAFALQITLGDLGEIIPNEIDAIAAAGGWLTKPQLRDWVFRSDDLTTPLVGPLVLQISELPMTRSGTAFLASAPSLNTNRTGQLYLPAIFPMLAGFL